MYASINYLKVKEEIENRRKRAIAEAEMRTAEVEAKSPKFEAINKELSKTGLVLFGAACRGEDLEPIKKRNLALQEQKRAELVALGYCADYTEPKYTCPICSDTGSVNMRLCTCFKTRLVTENVKSSGIGALIEKQSFENFDLDWYRDDAENYKRMEHNLAMAKGYAEGFGNKTKNLVLVGKTGVGKTHITTAIAKVVIEKGYNVIYDTAQNIVSDFEQDRFKSGYGPYEPRAEKYLECDLLILDDLGTEFSSPFTVSCIYNLLNTRQNKGLPTVVSTNLEISELMSKYDGRIASRLVGADSGVMIFGGKDHRIFGNK
ncbi:MAG: ATP-binding protein [Clostridia bacterium]|nr:ATP-binding protein [Clostridia bacterium]